MKKGDVVYHYGDEVEVQDWMGNWNVGKVLDLTMDGQYKVECCGLTCWLRPSDMRRMKRA